VIYFFHGWGGRYKSDDNAKLAYEKITDLVNKYQVILVMWDGNVDENEPRPYNIGNHADVKYDVQMKDYFIELMSHIDSAYRSIPDKNNRGIIGFSMGGFMSYFLAGKYPDKVAAAVGMTGSPEFFVGYPDNHTLYPLRYTFKNLREVRLRFHNSTADELTYLNTEVHNGAQWEGDLDYEYWQFAGGHVVDQPGETKVFEKAMSFVVNTFSTPMAKPSIWSHYDLYPEFEVYGYVVKTDKREPGFTFLNRVSRSGFGTSTHKWLPAGPPLKCNVDFTTAPLYQPNTTFNIVRYVTNEKRVTIETSKSDVAGRLHFNFDGKEYETGIYQAGDAPELTCTDYSIDKSKKLLRIPAENKLSLTVFNRGGEINTNESLNVSLISLDSSITIINGSVTVRVDPRTRIFTTPEFRILSNKKPPHDGSPSEIKFKIRINLGDTSFEDELTVPVLFDVPSYPSVAIDDGRATSDTVKVFGKGNGDGKASAGEQIMIYANGHKLRLYTDDPYVQTEMETLIDEVLPAKWPDGFTLSSVIKIDDNCPAGHVIECIGNYETKGFMPIERKVTWGKVRIQVSK
ncbi:MAG: hypothetical protein C0490_19340, partial [Marivirga sp.]|nr:hypothetical protein [Marivirga sp.]